MMNAVNEKTRYTKRGLLLRGILPVFVAAALLCFAGMADAARRTVTSGGDAGVGTLRYVVENAVAGDTIVFHPSVTTVNLNSYLFVDKALTIYGPVTIKQTAGGRVLHVKFQADCTFTQLTITGGNTGGGPGSKGAGVINYANLTMYDCTVSGNSGGGGIHNGRNMTLNNCVIMNNSSSGGDGNDDSLFGSAGGIGNSEFGSSLTMTDCVVVNNTCSNGLAGGIYNGDKATLTMVRTTIYNNRNSCLGGGMYLSTRATTTLTDHCAVYGNSPDNICGATYSADYTCRIGNWPNKSATKFLGYRGEKEPEPRSIVGDSDVAAVKSALANPQSALYGVIEQTLAADLGKTVPEKSTSLAQLAGMAATLYDANTFEDLALTSTDLSVEYTASWPENARYYALFARADESGYELAERGVQFEIKAGQSLPDGATPPDFYEEGEGLMTWRNVVTDGGSFDLEPAPGIVTFRVCSVRAAEAPAASSGGSGCSTDVASPLALLLAIPLLLLRKMQRKTHRTSQGGDQR